MNKNRRGFSKDTNRISRTKKDSRSPIAKEMDREEESEYNYWLTYPPTLRKACNDGIVLASMKHPDEWEEPDYILRTKSGKYICFKAAQAIDKDWVRLLPACMNMYADHRLADDPPYMRSGIDYDEHTPDISKEYPLLFVWWIPDKSNGVDIRLDSIEWVTQDRITEQWPPR